MGLIYEISFTNVLLAVMITILCLSLTTALIVLRRKITSNRLRENLNQRTLERNIALLKKELEEVRGTARSIFSLTHGTYYVHKKILLKEYGYLVLEDLGCNMLLCIIVPDQYEATNEGEWKRITFQTSAGGDRSIEFKGDLPWDATFWKEQHSVELETGQN